MLTGLDAVDWNDIEDAYGPATQVPNDLEALAAHDPERRHRGFVRLSNSVNHQGAAAPAAVAVVPFLVQLVAAPDVEDKTRLLRLLADLSGGGNHALWLPDGFPGFDDMPLEELEDPAALHQRVEEGFDAYVARLDAPDASERAAALLLLAFLPANADRSRPLVRARLAAEQDPDVRASGLVALGLIDRLLRSTDDLPLFQEALASRASGPLVRVAAAMALVYATPGDVPQQVMRSGRRGEPEVRRAPADGPRPRQGPPRGHRRHLICRHQG